MTEDEWLNYDNQWDQPDSGPIVMTALACCLAFAVVLGGAAWWWYRLP